VLYSIALIIAIAILIYLQKQYKKMPEKDKKRWLQQRALWVGAGIIILLVISGRAHWLMGVLAGLMAAFSRIAQMASYFPFLKKVFGIDAAASDQQSAGQGNMPSTNTGMTLDEAADILGIDSNASKEEIIKQHKRLMQRLHPDRGGSDALAAKINEARDTLLAQFD
jgi:hypothetical protein